MRKKLLSGNVAVTRLMTSIVRVSMVVFLVLSFTTKSFSQAQLLKDIYDQQEMQWNEYSHFTDGKGTFFFASGASLWKSNHTIASTLKLKDFKSLRSLKWVGNSLFFVANDGVSGEELWRSNGTASSTVRVKDISPGVLGSAPAKFTDVNGVLYFVANAGSGEELWKSDGSAAGTVMIKDILPKIGSSKPSFLTVRNGVLYFSANDGTNGYELWKSDGTSAGTTMVKDIRPETKVSSAPEQITNVNGTLYFVANDGMSGRELWKSDGTAEGTVRVKDIRAGAGASGIENLCAVGNTLFFTASDGTHGNEIWKSDGTEAGTQLLKDMTPGVAGSNDESGWGHHMGNFTNVDGTLFYTAYQGQVYYMWKSDGTTAGTIPVQPCDGPGYDQPAPHFIPMNGYIYYFNGSEASWDEYYHSLWRMDMNGANPTKLITFQLLEPYSPEYPLLVRVKDYLYVAGANRTQGFAIYQSNGTPDGTHLFIDTHKRSINSNPFNLTSFNGHTYFMTQIEDEYPYGDWFEPQLWRTDGTPEGTVWISDEEDLGTSLVVASNRLFIVGSNTLRVIKAGAEMEWLKTFNYPHLITKKVAVNGTLYFTTGGKEVWRSNGTAAGTIQLATDHTVTFLAAQGNKLMYGRIAPDGSEELWTSNGTASGTVKIKTIRSGPGVRSRFYPTAVYQNIFYFIANDGVHGNEIWRSDGTEAGTRMVLNMNHDDILENGTEYDYTDFGVFNNRLFFSARRSDLKNGVDKWQVISYQPISYQGNSAVVNIIGDLPPVEKFISTPEKLYITAETSQYTYWRDLYVYTSTQALTKLSTIQASYRDRPDFVYADGLLYYSTTYLQGLNVTDGTVCGTRSVDIGVNSPYPIEALGNNLIFGAYGPNVGNEPHVYNRSLLPENTCETLAAQSGDVTILGSEGEELVTSYPNPFKSEFNFRINGKDNEPVHLSVFTPSGTAVEEQNDLVTNTDYSLGSSWPAGMYILKVKNGGKIRTQKMIKNR